MDFEEDYDAEFDDNQEGQLETPFPSVAGADDGDNDNDDSVAENMKKKQKREAVVDDGSEMHLVYPNLQEKIRLWRRF